MQDRFAPPTIASIAPSGAVGKCGDLRGLLVRVARFAREAGSLMWQMRRSTHPDETWMVGESRGCLTAHRSAASTALTNEFYAREQIGRGARRNNRRSLPTVPSGCGTRRLSESQAKRL